MRRARAAVPFALLVALVAMSSSLRSAQPEPQARPAGRAVSRFRHYAGGKDLAGVRVARSRADALTALRLEGDDQLPADVRVRADVPPVESAAGATRVLRFGLHVSGVPVAGGDFVAIVGANGRLLASRTRGVPAGVDATAPTTAVADAIAVASDDARQRTGVAGFEASTPTLEIWVDAEGRGRLAWTLTLRGTAGEAPVARRYRIAAIGRPAVLSADDLVHDATVQVVAPVFTLSPVTAPVVAAVPHVSVTAAGAAGLTDGTGTAVFAKVPPGAGLSSRLQGTYARVLTSVGPPLTASGTAVTGSLDVLSYTADTEFTLAQTTAYVWASFVSRWARDRVPALDAILGRLDVQVNANLPCNAFSAGGLITFGRAGAPCRNMATPTVIAHEFGHEVHLALAGGAIDVSYSEGFSDALSTLVTDQPCVGVDFVGAGSCLRRSTDVTPWPVASGDPHEIGRPYAQFVWQLRETLGSDLAIQSLLATVVALPSDVPDAVYLAFVADDDDGLLGTCSPHQLALQAAADSRNLPRPQDCRPAGENAPPTAVADVLAFIEDEGTRAVDLVGNDTDPDGDVLEIAQAPSSSLGQFSCSRHGCLFTPAPEASGIETVAYTVVDTFGGSSTGTVRIEVTSVEDQALVYVLTPPQGAEDVPVPLQAVAYDPDGPPLTVQWVVTAPAGAAPCVVAAPASAITTVTCSHDGVFALGIVATQAGHPIASALVPLEIANTQPNVAITSPAAGTAVAAGAVLNVSATFDDGPTPGPHTCAIVWGDGVTTTGVVTDATCTGRHVYAAGATGPQTISVFVADPGGAVGVAAVTVTIAPPTGSSCPAGATTCVALGAGTVSSTPATLFEFTASVVRGATNGQIALSDLRTFTFVGAVRTLSVTPGAATLRGPGHVNGRSGFTFEATAVDRRPGRDALRLVIRDAAGQVVRDVGGDVIRGEIVVR